MDTEAAKAEEQERPLDCTIEDVGPCKKRLSIKVTGEEIDDEIDKQYAEIIRTYQFKGFRKGKVPRKLVERMLGDHVLDEVKQSVVVDSFERAVEQNELAVLGEPEFDVDDLEVKRGQGVEFAITCEVKPAFDLPKLSDFEVERNVEAVEDGQVKEHLDRLARSRGKYEESDAKDIRPDDMLAGVVAVVQGEETLFHQEEYAFVPGEKRLFGMMVNDLPDRLVGGGLGETHEFEVDIPEYMSGPDSRLEEGTATIRVTPSKLKRMVIPTPDEDFAKSLDFDSVDDLKADIRKHLEAEAEKAADRAVEEKILDDLVAATPFDVPEGLVDRQVEASTERERLRMQIEGLNNLEIEEKIDLASGSQREEIVQNMKKAFLLEKLSVKEKIFVTEEMTDATIMMMASQQGRAPEEVRAELEERGQLRELRSELRERLTREALRKRAKITDKKAGGKD